MRLRRRTPPKHARPREPFARLHKLSPSHKGLLAAVALLTVVGLTGIGVQATFTTSTSASHSASTGTLTLDLGTAGTSANRLTLDAPDLLPGEAYFRRADLINTGTRDLSSITLTTNATVSSLLDTDTTNGLQMAIVGCSVAWTELGTSPDFTYTCSGASSTVLVLVPVIGSNIALTNLTSVTAGNTDSLMLLLYLPPTAGDSFQGITSTLDFTFNGNQ